MAIWFVLLGTTFAIWVGVMVWLLVQVNRDAKAARAAAGKGPFQGLGQTLGAFRAAMRDPRYSAERRAVISATLALFLLIFSRPYFIAAL